MPLLPLQLAGTEAGAPLMDALSTGSGGRKKQKKRKKGRDEVDRSFLEAQVSTAYCKRALGVSAAAVLPVCAA